MLPRSLDPRDLPSQLADFAHWFRYPLHARDFHPLRDAKSNVLRGYYTAKPLYGKLDARADGKRDWPAINAAAERALRRKLS